MKKLKPGHNAPDLNTVDIFEEPLGGGGSLMGRNYILLFSRYIGCPICQAQAHDLREFSEDIKSQKGRVILVLRSDRKILKSYFEEFFAGGRQGDFQVVADPFRKFYRLYGVGGNLAGYLDPRALLAGFRAMGKGFKHGAYEKGELQMPAAFIIDGGGKIAFAHYGRHANDQADTKTLFTEFKKIKY